MKAGEFLTGQSLADRIRAVCSEDEVDCAVAFWSGAVRDDLFPHWETQRIRIVCDISMGCNSQGSLRAYGAPNNPQLRVHDGLHAKVFISSAGAVIGSANASRNGIGRSNLAPGNLEAGVFFDAASAGWDGAKKFFKELWDEPDNALGPDQLARAPDIACDPGRRIGPDGLRSSSIFGRVFAEPSAFDGTLFVITGAEVDDGVEERLDEAHAQESTAGTFEPANRELVVQDTARVLAKPSDRVLMFWFGRPKRPELLAYHSGVRVSARRAHAVYGIKGWKRFWRELEMDPPSKADALVRDKALARKLCPSPDAKRDGWVGTAHELAAALAALGYRPSS